MDYKEFYEKIYAPRHEPPPVSSLARLWGKMELDRQVAAFQLLDSNERFLDVGCGFGSLVFLATQKFREVYGTDISESRISWNQEAAKNLNTAQIFFKQADMNEGIPFDDGHFDAVSCIASLELPHDIVRTIQEFNRVLKKEGQLVLSVSNIAYFTRRFRALLGEPPRVSSHADLVDGGVLRYFTMGSLRSLLMQGGFTIVETATAGKFWFLRSWWKSMLTSCLLVKAIKVK